MNIHIVVTGRSYHLAATLPDQLELPDNARVDTALMCLKAAAPELSLPASCLLAVSGRHIGSVESHANESLREGDELTIIAPVAGG